MKNYDASMTVVQESHTHLFETAKNIGPLLAAQVESEDANRRVSQLTLDALRDAGFLRLFLPKSLDGLEADPLTVALLVEEVARHNAAAGWTMMVANVSTWWSARLSAHGVQEVFGGDPHSFMAGAFHPPMSAKPVTGGYHIHGRSPLTSNVHEARWIFVSAFVMNGDQINMKNGRPEILGVVMNATHLRIIDTWQTTGMRSTDSNDIEANGVFVPDHLTFPLVPEFQANSYFRGALYRFPAIGASIASLITPVALAVARNAIAEVKALAERKIPFGSMVSIREKGTVQRKIGLAEAIVQAGRAYLHQTLSDCWNKIQAGAALSLQEKANVLLAATHTNQTCVQAVDLMYSAAGSNAIYTKNPLSRHFNNAQVIRHHGFANESRYETAAQVYLGLPPDLPVIAF